MFVSTVPERRKVLQHSQNLPESNANTVSTVPERRKVLQHPVLRSWFRPGFVSTVPERRKVLQHVPASIVEDYEGVFQLSQSEGRYCSRSTRVSPSDTHKFQLSQSEGRYCSRARYLVACFGLVSTVPERRKVLQQVDVDAVGRVGYVSTVPERRKVLQQSSPTSISNTTRVSTVPERRKVLQLYVFHFLHPVYWVSTVPERRKVLQRFRKRCCRLCGGFNCPRAKEGTAAVRMAMPEPVTPPCFNCPRAKEGTAARCCPRRSRPSHGFQLSQSEGRYCSSSTNTRRSRYTKFQLSQSEGRYCSTA